MSSVYGGFVHPAPVVRLQNPPTSGASMRGRSVSNAESAYALPKVVVPLVPKRGLLKRNGVGFVNGVGKLLLSGQ